MDDRTKRAAVALCEFERGAVSVCGQCKSCRNAHYVYNPATKEDDYVDLGDGCLGLGYESMAEAALAAADRD